MHRLTATDTPMVRYTRTIFPSYALSLTILKFEQQTFKFIFIFSFSFSYILHLLVVHLYNRII